MKKEKILELGKATIKITMTYNYNTTDLDGHVRQTNEIVKAVDVELWADGKLVQKTNENFIYLADGKTRFGNIYMTESTGVQIINAIEEMHKEMSAQFNTSTPTEEIEKIKEEVKAIEIESANKIMAELKVRKTDILSEKEEKQWRVNYNKINNEGTEGYIPHRITKEDVARAKEVLGI